MTVEFIYPDWPAPSHIKAFTTTRKGGLSKPPFDSFNLATHVGDDCDTVVQNRQLLSHYLPSEPLWLTQTHTTKLLNLDSHVLPNESFDGSITTEQNRVCVVLTADCLPILLTDIDGSFAAAVHAGWRGLANGIIENALKSVSIENKSQVLAWLGPAIGPSQFEVGEDVKACFSSSQSAETQAFKPMTNDSMDQQKWLCDIYMLARQKLNQLGVNKVFGAQHCSYNEADCFYSYRRDGRCGRMASCIWIEK